MPKTVRFILALFSGLSVITLVVFTLAAVMYRSRVYPNTYIAGVNVSNKQYGEAALLVDEYAKKLANLPVNIVVTDPSRPPQQAKTTVQGLGVSFQTSAALASVWQPTHRLTLQWPRQVLRAYFGSTQVDLPFTSQSQVVTNFITLHVDSLVTVPVAATLRVDGEGVSIIPSVPGVVVDRNELNTRLTTALTTVSDGDALTLLAPTHPSESSVTAASLAPLVTRINILGDSQITLAGDRLSLNPSRAQKLAWFVPFQDSEGVVHLKVDESKVATYLRAYPSVDAAASSVSIAKSLQEQLSASSSAALSRLSLAMNVVSPTPTQVGNVRLGLYPGKYLQINLAEQKLYRITGSTLEKVYPVSSGKASTPTPRGTFTLSGHAMRPLSSLYGLYMPYWINFKDGAYGVHELPEWPNGYKEGQGHLGTPVSDGCVRLGIGDAKEIYYWTPDGTPLLIQ